jgi:hypothetical protein
MPFLVSITVIAQISLIAHAAYRNRPFWWVAIILVLPIVGCIAYVIVEVLPQMTPRGLKVQQADRNALQSSHATPVAAPVKLDELTQYDSVNAKMAQAENCVNAGQYPDAVRLFESCTNGPHANDPHLLARLVSAYLLNGQYEASLHCIERIQSEHPKYRPQEIKLLRARALEGQHTADAALAVYRDLSETYVGFEAKARYGLFLKSLGRTGQARSVFNLIVGQARRASALIDSEKKWVKLAHQETLAG